MDILPRYLMRIERANSRTLYRYNPPADAVDAGVVMRKTVGEDYAAAVQYAEEHNKALDDWRKELKYLNNLSADSKVSDLIKSYKNSISFTKLNIKTQEDYTYYLNHWANSKVGGVPLMNAKICNIVTPMCQRIYEETAGRSVSLANHVLSVYRLVFNYAIRFGYAKFNPFTHILRRPDKPRRVIWERGDVTRFLDTAYSKFNTRNIGLIVQMAYEWGQRMGDMRTLTWDMFNFETGVLNLEQSKRRAKVSLPTSPSLREMLKQQHDEYGWQKYIAPSNVPDRKGGLKPFTLFTLSRAGNKIMIDAGLPKELKLMDLRRTAVTEMIEAGVPLTNVMSVTGHSTPQSVAPYIKHTLKSAAVAQSMRELLAYERATNEG